MKPCLLLYALEKPWVDVPCPEGELIMKASYTNMPLIYQKYDNGMARSATQYFCMGISYKHPSGRTEQKIARFKL